VNVGGFGNPVFDLNASLLASDTAATWRSRGSLSPSSPDLWSPIDTPFTGTTPCGVLFCDERPYYRGRENRGFARGSCQAQTFPHFNAYMTMYALGYGNFVSHFPAA
jgi:hypothetical protein